jgi:ABC-type transport system substrate-binding protein
MKRAAVVLSVTLAPWLMLTSMPSAAWAHHSAAATYDDSQSIPITGIVASFAWRNPHSHLYIDVTAGPFKGKEYVIELSSPVVLAEEGWSPSSFRAGDRVTVYVKPSRSGAPIGLCRPCAVTVNDVTRPRAVG